MDPIIEIFSVTQTSLHFFSCEKLNIFLNHRFFPADALFCTACASFDKREKIIHQVGFYVLLCMWIMNQCWFSGKVFFTNFSRKIFKEILKHIFQLYICFRMASQRRDLLELFLFTAPMSSTNLLNFPSINLLLFRFLCLMFMKMSYEWLLWWFLRLYVTPEIFCVCREEFLMKMLRYKRYHRKVLLTWQKKFFVL